MTSGFIRICFVVSLSTLIFAAPLLAEATRAQCTCDLETGGDRKDGGEVANAAACFLTEDENTNWCSFDVEALENSMSHQQFVLTLKGRAINGQASQAIRQVFERYLRSDDSAGRLERQFRVGPEQVSSEIAKLLDVNLRLFDSCLQAFAAREPGDFRQMQDGNNFSCGVDPDTGWLNLEFRFDGWTLLYLTEPPNA